MSSQTPLVLIFLKSGLTIKEILQLVDFLVS